MKTIIFLTTALSISTAVSAAAQRPPQGPPGDARAPRAEGPHRPGAERGPQAPHAGGEWFRAFDTNADKKLDTAEMDAASSTTFETMDRDQSGILESAELRPPRRKAPPPDRHPEADRDNVRTPKPNGGKPLLPPFFYMKGVEPGTSVAKADFLSAVRTAFIEMDKDGNGNLTLEETRPARGHDATMPPPPPNAQFIGAELRFGDKLVKGQPFSAETVMEDSRRLFDGTVVTKQNRGAIFRDSAGRTRREQPLSEVGGFNVVGDDSKPQVLVFINDINLRAQYFLDMKNKAARKNAINGDPRPGRPDAENPEGAKNESLGARVIEGVSCEGTRTTFEIPAGQIGNDKPIQVVSEKWFSPELQVVVMSRHLDPLAGEHVFKLVNIKRAEPATDLFIVPAGFRIEEQRAPRP